MIAPLRSEVRLLDVVRSLFGCRGYRQKLERELAAFFGVEKVLLTHSARTAICFLLRSLPQKKVYLPAYNCWAVTEAALQAQKEIEYVDISLDDYNMDVGKLRNCLEPDSIILATHQFGSPCDMPAIQELARERNCIVLEDNAAAFGSELYGKKTGTLAPAGVVSFDYSKMVVSGKGGAILFSDTSLYPAVKALLDKETHRPPFLKTLKYLLLPLAYSYATHLLVYPLTYRLFPRIRGGSSSLPSYDLSADNESYRLDYDEHRAKLAYFSLRRLPETMARRKRVTEYYEQELSNSRRLMWVFNPSWADAALVKFPIRLGAGGRRQLYERCVARGFDPPFLFQFHHRDRDGSPNAALAAREAMALPVYGALTERELYRMTSFLLDERTYAADVAGPDDGSVEQRRFFCFTLNYYWMDPEAFLESDNGVSLLRSSEVLPKDQYSFRILYKTFMVDLSKPKEEIYAGFDYTRAICPIKKSIKKGVVIKRAETLDEKLRYHDFYHAFANDPKRKNKILVIQREELDRLEVLYALSPDGEFLGGIGLLPSRDRRFILAKYSATLHRFNEQDLLVWQAIQYAKDAGYAFFDLSWMVPSDDPNSDQYRLFQYKKKFGGDLVDFYSYVKFKGMLKPLGALFQVILNKLFQGDINRVALLLKKTGAFR